MWPSIPEGSEWLLGCTYSLLQTLYYRDLTISATNLQPPKPMDEPHEIEQKLGTRAGFVALCCDAPELDYDPSVPNDLAQMEQRKTRLLRAAEVRQKVSPLDNKGPNASQCGFDDSLEDVFKRRQGKSMAKAQQMMEKMGW